MRCAQETAKHAVVERERSTLFILPDKNDHSEQDIILISELSKYPHQKRKTKRKQVIMGTLVSQVLWYLALVLHSISDCTAYSAKAHSIYKDVIKECDSLGCRRQKEKMCFHLIICLNLTWLFPSQEKQWVLKKWQVAAQRKGCNSIWHH